MLDTVTQTSVFGAGLIEAISDSVIHANQQANAAQKSALGISGHPNAILSGNVNRSANDGTITPFPTLDLRPREQRRGVNRPS